MKKRILLAVILSVLLSLFNIEINAADIIKVMINGDRIDFTEANPFIENGTTLVPMRKIFETLGMEVEWDAETQSVIAYREDYSSYIIFVIGEYDAIIDNEIKHLNAAPRIVNSVTMVPLRFIAENMNYDVQWDGDSQVININDKIKPPPRLLYFVSYKDEAYKRAMEVIEELKADYKDRVLFEITNIDDNPEVIKQYPVQGNTPMYIMINSDGDISAMNRKCYNKSEIIKVIERSF